MVPPNTLASQTSASPQHQRAAQVPARAAFSAGAHGDLRGPLLWLALVFGLAEVGLASVWGRRA